MNFIYGPHTTAWCHAPPLPPASVCTTSVSISCYRLFPPNLHTQNNLTVQRRHLPFASPSLSLGQQQLRPHRVDAANKFPFSQPTRATCLPFSPPSPSDQRIPLELWEFVILHNCCIWSPSAAKLICQMENCHFVSNVAHAARGQKHYLAAPAPSPFSGRVL